MASKLKGKSSWKPDYTLIPDIGSQSLFSSSNCKYSLKAIWGLYVDYGIAYSWYTIPLGIMFKRHGASNDADPNLTRATFGCIFCCSLGKGTPVLLGYKVSRIILWNTERACSRENCSIGRIALWENKEPLTKALISISCAWKEAKLSRGSQLRSLQTSSHLIRAVTGRLLCPWPAGRHAGFRRCEKSTFEERFPVRVSVNRRNNLTWKLRYNLALADGATVLILSFDWAVDRGLRHTLDVKAWRGELVD